MAFDDPDDISRRKPKKKFLFRRQDQPEKEKQQRKVRNFLRGKVETHVYLDPKEQALVLQDQNATVRENEKELNEDPWTIKGYAMVRDLETDEERVVTQEIPPLRVHSLHRTVSPNLGIELKTYKIAVMIFCMGMVCVNMWHTFFWALEDNRSATLLFQYIAKEKFSEFYARQLSYKYCVLIGFIPFFTGMGGILSFNIFENEYLMVYLFVWSPILAIPLNIYLGCNRTVYNRITLKQLEAELYRSMFTYNIATTGKHGFETDFWNRNQYHLHCCGVKSLEDWWQLDWGYWGNRTDKPRFHKDGQRVPPSCCKKFNHFIEIGALNRTAQYSWTMLRCQFHYESEIHKDGCLIKIWENYLEIVNNMLWCVMMYNLCTILGSAAGFFAYVKYKRQTQPDFKYTIIQYFLDLVLIGIWIKRTGKVTPEYVEPKSLHEFEHIADPKIQTSQSSYFKATKTEKKNIKENIDKDNQAKSPKTGSNDKLSPVSYYSRNDIEVLLPPRESFLEEK